MKKFENAIKKGVKASQRKLRIQSGADVTSASFKNIDWKHTQLRPPNFSGVELERACIMPIL